MQSERSPCLGWGAGQTGSGLGLGQGSSCKKGQGLHLYKARPASTAVQSMAKSIWRTKGDILAATVCAALSTTLGCARMILEGKVRGAWAGGGALEHSLGSGEGG